MYEQAIELCEKSLQSDPTNPPFLTLAGYAYAKDGQRQKAEEIIKRWKEIAKTQYVSHYWIAPIYAALGERNEAFAELEKAFAERDYFMPRLKVDPFMDALRDDPRFKEMLKRMNLPE
jgi:tetratricopeptide (TPR) repeat protein